MSKIKQSLAWWALANKIGADKLIAESKRIGYEGVEMAPSELWPQITDGGLKIITMGGHQSLSDGLNRRENHDRIEREIVANLELAVKWQIPALIVFSGNRQGQDDPRGHDATVAALRAIAPYAKHAGVTLGLELLNSRIDHPGYLADHTGWGVSVVERVGSTSVKLLYDVYHMQIMEGDLIRTIQAHHPHIAHYHTAGNPGRHDLDDEQEIQYGAVFRAIRDTGFDGFIAHEFIPKGDPLLALRRAFEFCQASLG